MDYSYTPNNEQYKFRQKVEELLKKRKDPAYVQYALTQVGYDEQTVNAELSRMAGIQYQDPNQVQVDGRQFQVNTIADQKAYSDLQGAEALKKVQETNLKTDLEKKISGLDALTKDTAGIGAAVGPNPLARPVTPFSGDKQRFIGSVEELISTDTLQTLINAKAEGATFGALSEGELRLLQASASKIGKWAKRDSEGNVVGYNVNEQDFLKELNTLKEGAAKALESVNKVGDTTQTSPGATQSPVTLNSPEEAAKWLQANPNDPRASQVQEKLNSIGYDTASQSSKAPGVATTQVTPQVQTDTAQPIDQNPKSQDSGFLNAAAEFTGVKKFGQGIGTALFLKTQEGQDLQKKVEQGDKVAIETLQGILNEAPNAKELIGSAALTALNLVSGGAAGKGVGLAGKTAVGATVGAGYGLAGGLEQNKDASGIAKSTATGAAIGGALSAASVGVGKATDYIKSKNYQSLPEKAKKAVGQIIQGKTKDVKPALRVLNQIDPTNISTYKDLSSHLDENVKLLGSTMDSVLSKDTTARKLSQLQKVSTVGGKQVKSNYVKEALNGLDELYSSSSDPENAQRIKNLIEKSNKSGITVKEINDIAKEYGGVFGDKAFSKSTGDALTSVNATAYENVRKGVKNTLRGLLPDNQAKLIDSNLSDHIQTKKLVDKMVEKANTLSQKVDERGLIEKVGRITGKTVDLASGGFLKGTVGALIPSNAGNKSLNSLGLEGNLAKNLKLIDKADTLIDNSKFNVYLEKFLARKKTGLTLPVLLNAVREFSD